MSGLKKNVSILEIKKSKKNNLATEIIRLDLDVVFKDRDSMLGRRGGSRIIISRFLLRVSKLMCIIFDAKIGSKKTCGISYLTYSIIKLQCVQYNKVFPLLITR